MLNSIAASLALFAAGATAIGQAQVQNNCPYEVYLTAVPAEGGGYSQQTATLSSGGSWSQTYTELTNGDGWSIKLSNSTSLDSILQFEYTVFLDTGILWWDLSAVNGDPWLNDWFISADDGCVSKQTAYLYSTDNANGMQESCDSTASTMVTLCDSSADDDSDSSSSASAAAPASSYVPPTSSVYSAPAPSSTEAPASTSQAAPASTSTPQAVTTSPSTSESAAASSTTGWNWSGFHDEHGFVEDAADNTPAVAAATTLATSVVSQEVNGADVTVVEIVTAVETAIVTATAYGRHRRHEHHGHQHHHA